jgi:hypothetical protein
MGKEAEIAEKFWKALRSDRTLMIGLVGMDDGSSQPMTALLDEAETVGRSGSSARRTLTRARARQWQGRRCAFRRQRAMNLFATVHGRLVPDNDRAAIDRL